MHFSMKDDTASYTFFKEKELVKMRSFRQRQNISQN